MPKKFPIGMRNIKTALAVLICMLIFVVFGKLGSFITPSDNPITVLIKFLLARENPIFACVAAVIVMQNSVENAKGFAVSRFLGTTVGVTSGIVFLWLDTALMNRAFNFIFVFAGIILLICLCNLIKHPDASSISIITFLVIMISIREENPFIYAVNRIIDTILGITISLAVNFSIKKPVYSIS